MSLPLLITLLGVFFLSILTISSSVKLAQAQKRIRELEKERNWQRITSEIMNEVTQAIDASQNLQRVVHIIAKHVGNTLPYTTLSTLVVFEDTMRLQTTARESVSHGYIETIKHHMLESLATIEQRSFRDLPLTEDVTGQVNDTTKTQQAETLVHLPLMLHTSVAALITVTSMQPNHFSKTDRAALHNILVQTSKLLSKMNGLLEEEKGKLTAMMESLSDGLLLIDAHHNLQTINHAARQLLGLKQERVTTMDVLSALPIHFDFKNKLDLAIHHDQPSEIGNVPIHNKQLRVRITPIHGTTGKILGATLLIHDETLTNSVPRMKEDFTNILVHELRNPLTSIKASSELLISSAHFSPDEQSRLLHVIFEQSRKLLNEVQQILDAAKLEAGVFTIHKKTADLKTILNDVTHSFQKEAQEKMINYTVDIDFNLPAFSFDEKYISQALSNLLSNSMKFTSHGGTIHISAKGRNGNVVITIADTGAGIPKDKQHKLFNKFSQIEEASATVGKGLGLYIVRGIIEAHGGSVVMDSDTGRGTTITLTLPIVDAAHDSLHHDRLSDPHRLVN